MSELIWRHGPAPYQVAVIHGGPGAPGSAGLLARELSKHRGILEPWQSALTVDGQVEELCAQLNNMAAPPVVLIGWSWGAMLALFFAAKYPQMVSKLILVGSGPFDAQYAANIRDVRMSRLTDEQRAEADKITIELADEQSERKDELLARMGDLFTRTDDFEPVDMQDERMQCDYAVHRGVWDDAKSRRERGEFLEIIRGLQCPVVALHGDYDSHPADGVAKPLSTLSNFRFHLLKNCGHRPWVERQARDEFFRIVGQELDEVLPPIQDDALAI